jgi:uncharacterized protein YbaP (TraB family)
LFRHGAPAEPRERELPLRLLKRLRAGINKIERLSAPSRSVLLKLEFAVGTRGGMGSDPKPAVDLARGTALRAWLLMALLLAAPVRGQAQLDEIVVTGERAGPSMWHVHRADAHVYILGSMTPLPRGITWRSRQVEETLGVTRQVLVQKPFEISMTRILWVLITDRGVLLQTHGRHLKDALPPPLYERFDAQRRRYTDDPKKWEHYRPIVAAAFLQREAFHRVGLSLRLDLGAAVRKLAKDQQVRVEEVKMAGTGDMLEALKDLPPAVENICVEASLVSIESAMPRYLERAQAWVDGNIEKLQTLPLPQEVDACRSALDVGHGSSDLITRMRRSWVEALEKSLQSRGTTLAVVNFDLLLEKGGVLDQLRAAGFTVDPP